uniref:Uncharacterized protein n=1 Tax=Timema douglasi TaxID=61478 RepID=A0A7R8VPM3_TIMDO|nr:unnamed protein product [Timema douglasi]
MPGGIKNVEFTSGMLHAARRASSKRREANEEERKYGSYEDYDEGTADYYDTTESYPVFAVCLSALLLADETTNRWKGFKTPSSGVATDRSRFRPTPYARPAKSAGKVLGNKLADTRGQNGKYPETMWTKWPKVQDHQLGDVLTKPPLKLLPGYGLVHFH